MSFDKLTVATRKKEEVVISASGGDITFYANELSYTQKMSLSALTQNNTDPFSIWLSLSITDQDGKRMTINQAENLPDEIVEKMFAAVMRVNKSEEIDEKKN